MAYPQSPLDSPRLAIPIHYNITNEVLDRNLAHGRGDREAIWCEDRTFTYAHVARLVARVGHALLRSGVEREQRVLLILPDSPELAASFLAAMRIGAVAVPCNSWLGPAEYGYFLRETRAKVLITSADLFERIEPALSGAPWLRNIVITGDAGAPKPDDANRRLSWDAWIAGKRDQLAAADTSRDDVALWLWTSGSTGEPKAALHLHQDWAFCCELYAGEVLGYSEADRSFSVSKLFHAYGLGNALMFPFWFGASTVLHPGRPLPDAVYTTIHRAKPTLFFGVPTAFAAMLQVPDAEQQWDLGSLRCCVSAGEPLPAELYRRWRARFGTEVLDGIGSTEALHMYMSARRGEVVPGSSGSPIPGYDVRIVNEGGDPVPPGVVGDLLVKGPSLALRYWNRAEQTRQKMRGEWFFSGDKYRCDEAGHYWYAGRSDDMFKVGGEWVSPAEVEGALVEHPSVLECAVVPLDIGGGLLKPKAVVVLARGIEPHPGLSEELRQFARTRVAAYKCPRAVEFVPELPKTATGKIQRFKLRGAPAAAAT